MGPSPGNNCCASNNLHTSVNLHPEESNHFNNTGLLINLLKFSRWKPFEKGLNKIYQDYNLVTD